MRVDPNNEPSQTPTQDISTCFVFIYTLSGKLSRALLRLQLKILMISMHNGENLDTIERAILKSTSPTWTEEVQNSPQNLNLRGGFQVREAIPNIQATVLRLLSGDVLQRPNKRRPNHLHQQVPSNSAEEIVLLDLCRVSRLTQPSCRILHQEPLDKVGKRSLLPNEFQRLGEHVSECFPAVFAF
ncbi:hypothetical protein Fmac_005096 [Flemingia macrophylla]|uniref:Uncharacterized protein n=1 Tax=Flemingia macrophylla TaxID=520843 RepID=A0ABD1N6R9_9FABA